MLSEWKIRCAFSKGSGSGLLTIGSVYNMKAASFESDGSTTLAGAGTNEDVAGAGTNEDVAGAGMWPWPWPWPWLWLWLWLRVWLGLWLQCWL